MPPAPWLAPLSRALDASLGASPAARYLQVATVRADGRPTVRTVVFRGWFEGGKGPRLGFVTDARTDKVAQAATTPYAEACWYFRETRDQFRLGGTLTIVDGGNTDGAAAWARLSPSAREWNAGPAPGVVKGKVVVEATTTTSAPAAEVGGGGGGGGDAATPHAHFRLVLLDIDSVDHVALESDRRWRHSLAGEEWETVEVNP